MVDLSKGLSKDYPKPWRIVIDQEFRRKANKAYWLIFGFLFVTVLVVDLVKMLWTGDLEPWNLTANVGVAGLAIIARPWLLNFISRHRFVQVVSDEELISLARRLKENRVKRLRWEADELMQQPDRSAIGDLMHKWHAFPFTAPHYAVPSEAKRLYGPREMDDGEKEGDQ